LTITPQARIADLVEQIYGQDAHEEIFSQIMAIITPHRDQLPQRQPEMTSFSERDAIMITYGDQFKAPGQSSLDTLLDFADNWLGDAISGIHILPFFPYSSDDGFSVIDFREVDPDLGSWEDIVKISGKYRLMVDLVINHKSRQSEWFQGFIKGDEDFLNYFITGDPDEDLSHVVRPRALPLLTPVQTTRGLEHVWTTFSEDQIDLNFRNPAVLIRMIDILLEYVKRGAEIIRLDAIAYLWKEIKHPSIHHPKTHLVVKLLRAVLDEHAPYVVLITETNVPHKENIQYFGSPLPVNVSPEVLRGRNDEAQMVYQFPLAPLVVDALVRSDGSVLSSWAAQLETPTPGTTFFNFIASHDGIGVRPAEGILNASEIQELANRTIEHGGEVSYKNNPDGSQTPYELNITLYDLLNPPDEPQQASHIDRFMASQAIMLSLAGVPGIYVHSLLGSSNCQACFKETGRARSLNREKFNLKNLSANLKDPSSKASMIFRRFKTLLKIRGSVPQLHPDAEQIALTVDPRLFCLVRGGTTTKSHLIAIVNLSDKPIHTALTASQLSGPIYKVYRDVITKSRYPALRNSLPIELAPYQYIWLIPEP
jgi:glucosylglycerate phosphorylase